MVAAFQRMRFGILGCVRVGYWDRGVDGDEDEGEYDEGDER